MSEQIKIDGKAITIFSYNEDDYISLTDMAKYKDSQRTDYIIQNWLRNRTTIEFLGIWEQFNNSTFKPIEFDGFRKQAGLNSFVLTSKQWIEKTNAIGLIAKSGRYGGTYAHKDIAFEFASWISVELKLYLIKEFALYRTTGAKEPVLQIRIDEIEHYFDKLKILLSPSSFQVGKQISYIPTVRTGGFDYASRPFLGEISARNSVLNWLY